MECEEFCLLVSAMVENLNLEDFRHASSISGAVKTWRPVTAGQISSTDLQAEPIYRSTYQQHLGVYRWTNQPLTASLLWSLKKTNLPAQRLLFKWLDSGVALVVPQRTCDPVWSDSCSSNSPLMSSCHSYAKVSLNHEACLSFTNWMSNSCRNISQRYSFWSKYWSQLLHPAAFNNPDAALDIKTTRSTVQSPDVKIHLHPTCYDSIQHKHTSFCCLSSSSSVMVGAVASSGEDQGSNLGWVFSTCLAFLSGLDLPLGMGVWAYGICSLHRINKFDLRRDDRAPRLTNRCYFKSFLEYHWDEVMGSASPGMNKPRWFWHVKWGSFLKLETISTF